MPLLHCSADDCDVVIGREYPATHWEPGEVTFYNEEQVDENGYGYCDYHWAELQQMQKDLKEQEDEDKV